MSSRHMIGQNCVINFVWCPLIGRGYVESVLPPDTLALILFFGVELISKSIPTGNRVILEIREFESHMRCGSAYVTGTTLSLLALFRRTLGSERHRYAIA